MIHHKSNYKRKKRKASPMQPINEEHCKVSSFSFLHYLLTRGLRKSSTTCRWFSLPGHTFPLFTRSPHPGEVEKMARWSKKVRHPWPRETPTSLRFLEKSAYVIDREVIDFSNNFQKHPYGH
ncbi:hypothetical protein TNCV_2062021 [Trichonephila clavipes]|nr:hypothetical protein TNCV_2062021 [Trichonephila clavipes]